MAVAEGTTFVYSVRECRLYPLVSDPAPPGEPTYGSGMDVPGVQRVTAKFTTEEKDLRGDGRTLDTRNTVKDVELSVEHALLSHDVLSLLIGGTSTVTGVTPNRISEWTLEDGDSPGYFMLAFRVVEVDGEGADFHFVAHKCKLTGSPELGAEIDDYKTASFDCRGISCRSNGSWVTTSLHETATPLA